VLDCAIAFAVQMEIRSTPRAHFELSIFRFTYIYAMAPPSFGTGGLSCFSTRAPQSRHLKRDSVNSRLPCPASISRFRLASPQRLHATQ
jgi:hypothetical protein